MVSSLNSNATGLETMNDTDEATRKLSALDRHRELKIRYNTINMQPPHLFKQIHLRLLLRRMAKLEHDHPEIRALSWLPGR